MDAPVVTIKRCVVEHGTFFDVFIDYAGRRFHTRDYTVTSDSPHMRASLAQEFLRRLKRFPSTLLTFNEQAPAQAARIASMDDLPLNEFAKLGGPPAISHKPLHGGHPDSNSHKNAPGEYGSVVEPQRRRPSLSVVKS